MIALLFLFSFLSTRFQRQVRVEREREKEKNEKREIRTEKSTFDGGAFNPYSTHSFFVRINDRVSFF